MIGSSWGGESLGTIQTSLWTYPAIALSVTVTAQVAWFGRLPIMGCLHDPANFQQTSSKCIQNRHTWIAGRLLDVCWSKVASSALLTSYRLDITNYAYTFSFNALVWGDPLRICRKALRFLKLESSGQPPKVKIWCLPCTDFDWSTYVTDGRTDGQTDGQTDRQNCDC